MKITVGFTNVMSMLLKVSKYDWGHKTQGHKGAGNISNYILQTAANLLLEPLCSVCSTKILSNKQTVKVQVQAVSWFFLF